MQLLGLITLVSLLAVLHSPLASLDDSTSATSDATVIVDRSQPLGASRLDVGVSHMQYSLDPWGDQKAVQQGKELLRTGVQYSNQHIMGFGADNPEPSPGVYDWSSLDRRIQLARELGLTPVITLCCAPDWMKGGSAGNTDWSMIEVAPLPSHYADFAELARQVALRYPDVRHYIVWNELKGFWSQSLNNWDYRAYTSLYNLVYDAVKSANSGALVGGPYLVIEGTGSQNGFWGAAPITPRNMKVIDYWLKYKRGADFIVLDRSVQDVHDPATYTTEELLRFTVLYRKVAAEIQMRTSLPIWWAEDYFTGSGDWNLQAVGLASLLYNQLISGSAVSLRWEPEAQPGAPFGGNDQNLFSSTLSEGGGKPFPAYYVYRAFHQFFPPGTLLYRASSSDPSLDVLASADHVLLVNKRPASVRVSINGESVATLSPYQVLAL